MLADEAVVAEDDALLAAGPLAKVGRPTDHAAPKTDAIAQVGVVVDDGTRDERFVADDHVGAKHAVLVQLRTGLDAAVVTEHHWAVDDGVGAFAGENETSKTADQSSAYVPRPRSPLFHMRNIRFTLRSSGNSFP